MATGRRLSRLLVISHVGLALLLAALLLVTGAGTIRAAIQERAQAQATQAAADALARLQDQRRDVAVIAGLLTERPTLQGYLRRNQRTAAGEFLDAFRQTARVDYILSARGGEVFAETGDPPPDTARAGLQADPAGGFWLVGTDAMQVPDGARVVVARRLSERTLAAGGDADEDIALLAVAELTGPAGARIEPEVRNAYRHVNATGTAETIGPLGDSAVRRIEPVRAASGRIEALLAASIPREVVARDTLGWLGAFALGTFAVATLAALVAVWLARRIARPFGQLARAAERLGVGDLETPVEMSSTDLAEPVALAHSLESMRRQVRALTDSERRQRQELDAVLDGVEDGIIAVDDEQVIRYANRQFLALLGRREDDVLGQAFAAVLKPLPPEGAARGTPGPDPLQLARDNQLAHVTGRYLLRGEPRNLVVRSSAPMGGRQVAIIRKETSAEAARAMRDSILANLSHEFQTPLAAQIASIELLRDHLHSGDDAVATRLVEAQFRGALRLSQLVDNLLDSVRIESGEMRLRHEPVDLVGLVEDAVELMRPLTAQRDQHVSLKLPHSDRRLMGDTQRLSQVAVNLLANANKFAPDQSSIWVELVWGEETVSLWVEDEGPGLPPLARRADLFAPFRRAPDQEPSQRGTGLGLAIVRALVERHNGEVVLAEPRHRKGARFGVVLPLEPLHEAPRMRISQ